MPEAELLAKRRQALLKIAALQRSNVAARWQQVRQRPVARCLDSAVAWLRRPAGARTARGQASWLPFVGRSVGSLARSSPALALGALRLLRRPSWMSAALMAGRWWWERHERRQAKLRAQQQRLAPSRFKHLRA